MAEQDRDGDVQNVQDILDRLRDLAGKQDRVSIGDVVHAMGSAASARSC